MPRTYQMPASSIINKARIIINDTNVAGTGYRASDPEMLGWLNDALNLMLVMKPGLFTKTVNFTCTSGAMQLLEYARTVEFIEVLGILECDRMALDQFLPTWRSATPAAAVHWMRVSGEPFRFDVYPPAISGASIPLRYIESPAVLTAITDVVPVSENYEAALSEYVAGKAEIKDDEHSNTGRAAQLMDRFTSQVKGAG